MTTKTEAVRAAKQPAGKTEKASSGDNTAARSVAVLALCAIVSGLSGLALHKGFGVSVPFLAGFFLLLGFAFFLRLTVLVVATGWQQAAAEAAGDIAMRVTMGAFVAETELRKAQDAGAFK